MTSVINTSTRELLKNYRKRGFEDERFIREVATPNGRIGSNLMWEIWHRVYENVKDDRIGLETARDLPVGAYGVLDYMMLSSAMLGDIFKLLPRYFPIINSGASVSIETHRGRTILELRNPSDTPHQHQKRSVEYTFATLLQRFRIATQRRIPPCRIDLQHTSSGDSTFWGAQVNFRQIANQIVFDNDLLGLRLPFADRDLAETLTYRAEQLLHRIESNDDLVELVRKVLSRNLSKGNVDVEKTAKDLAMSGRNLQRKLFVQGTSYQAILDQLRTELAVRYLRQDCTLHEISYRLGFSEPSVFSRAFKRWTGQTIRQWKAPDNRHNLYAKS